MATICVDKKCFVTELFFAGTTTMSAGTTRTLSSATTLKSLDVTSAISPGIIAKAVVAIDIVSNVIKS